MKGLIAMLNAQTRLTAFLMALAFLIFAAYFGAQEWVWNTGGATFLNLQGGTR